MLAQCSSRSRDQGLSCETAGDNYLKVKPVRDPLLAAAGEKKALALL